MSLYPRHFSAVFALLLGLVFVPAFAAKTPPAYSVELPVNAFEKPAGDWLKPANWQQGHVPEGKEWAMIGDRTCVTLSQKAPLVHSLNVGGRTLSQLTLEKEASLSVAVLRIRSHINGAVGLVELKGGSLSIAQNAEKNVTGGVYIGDSPTYSSTGILRISGGRFEGRGLSVGTSMQARGVGTLSVVGSKASIDTQKDHTGARLVVFPGSTLEFVLDAEGVSPIDYSRTGALLKPGALVRVDGAQYKGKKTAIPLVVGRTTDEGARFECVGFPSDAPARIVVEKTGLMLRLGR